MGSYPEWFIGGPYHGMDKLTVAPNVPDYGEVRYDITGWLCDLYPNYSYADLGGYYSTYTRHVFDIGAVSVPLWADMRVTTKTEVASKLAEIMLAPHATAGEGGTQ